MALFRSPSDRKQIGIIAERMFDKNRQRFMGAYYQETERAFGYLFVDNRPDTPGNKQVLNDIFCSCRVYPTIKKSSQPEEMVETRFSKDLEVPTSCVSQFSRRKSKLARSANLHATCTLLQNYSRGVWCRRNVHLCRNPLNPRLPKVLYAGERYWPVKLRHFSNGTTKWIYLHGDEPSVKSFSEETIAA